MWSAIVPMPISLPQIADGDIRHAPARAARFQSASLLACNLRHIATHGIVVYALRVRAAGLH